MRYGRLLLSVYCQQASVALVGILQARVTMNNSMRYAGQLQLQLQPLGSYLALLHSVDHIWRQERVLAPAKHLATAQQH